MLTHVMYGINMYAASLETFQNEKIVNAIVPQSVTMIARPNTGDSSPKKTIDHMAFKNICTPKIIKWVLDFRFSLVQTRYKEIPIRK